MLFSPPSEVIIVDRGVSKRRTYGEGRRRGSHALLPEYAWDARLAPTLTCAGLRGCCSDGETSKDVGSVRRWNAPLAPTLTCAALGRCCDDGNRGGERSRCTGLGPRRPLCADDSCASGRGGVAAQRAPRFTEMRDDCPDQYHVEASSCRQRSSRRRFSTVSMRVNEGVSPAEEPFDLDVENYQPTTSIADVTLAPPMK